MEKRFQFVPMNDNYAEQIALWNYPPPYNFYDLKEDQEDLKDFLNPDNWPNKYFGCINNMHELIGYFIIDPLSKLQKIQIGLGLHPKF